MRLWFYEDLGPQIHKGAEAETKYMLHTVQKVLTVSSKNQDSAFCWKAQRASLSP